MRNYGVEMRELINKETEIGPYQPGAVAQAIVDALRHSDPDLLHGYLMEHAVQIIRDAINRRDQSVRMTARKGSASAKMQEILGGIESGQIENIGQVRQVRQFWLSATFTLSDGMRHELRTMRRGDLLYVAEEYGRRAAENKMEEAFFRALARKMQANKTVEDVLTEEEIVRIRDGLSKFK